MNVESSAVKKTKIVKNLLLDNAIENFNLGVNTSNAIIDKENAKLKEDNIALKMANALLKNELLELKNVLDELKNMTSKEILSDLGFVLRRQKEDNEKETK